MLKDPRVAQLAKTLVNHSCQVKPQELVLIEFVESVSLPLVQACVEEITQAGGIPFCFLNDRQVMRPFFVEAERAQYRGYGQLLRSLIEKIDCYIGILGGGNPFELVDLSPERKQFHSAFIWKSVHLDVRLHKRWVVLRFPTPALSVKAGLPTDTFEDLYFKVCNFNYDYLKDAIKPLFQMMKNTKEIRVVGPGTDLSFSVAGMPVVACTGVNNIPDGEIFTSPVLNSLEGTLTCNLPSLYHGIRFEGVKLTFRDGRVVEAFADSNQKKLEEILDMDEGARHVCEFAMGLNPFIQRPFMDPIFDEKMYGSFHIALGNAYEEADNGNRSGVHWDLISSQLAESGGGEIFFDGVLVRQDGHFVHPSFEKTLSLKRLQEPTVSLS